MEGRENRNPLCWDDIPNPSSRQIYIDNMRATLYRYVSIEVITISIQCLMYRRYNR